MTTARGASMPTALDLLFGPGTNAAETLAGEICRPAATRILPTP